MKTIKEYSLEVFSVQFYKIDEDGDVLLNKDGSEKLFYEENADYSYLLDWVESDDLKEVP